MFGYIWPNSDVPALYVSLTDDQQRVGTVFGAHNSFRLKIYKSSTVRLFNIDAADERDYHW